MYSMRSDELVGEIPHLITLVSVAHVDFVPVSRLHLG